MLMMSFRLRRTAVLAGGIALVLALTVGFAGIRKIQDTSASPDKGVSAEDTTAKAKKVSGKTNDDRVKFITSFGWEVEMDAAEIMEVIIPQEFDEVYEQYNSIQKKQGYDLEDFSGKRCKRYSYNVTNYPGTGEAVRINLLVYDNKIIGGDVCSLDANGFMHGFDAPQ